MSLGRGDGLRGRIGFGDFLVGGRLHGGVSGGRLLEAPDEVPLCPFEFLLPLRQRMEIVFPPYA